MSSLVVDVLFHGQVVDTVAFDRPTLRIGRMPENDVPIDNLAVSRFHARLHLDEGRVFLEDAGSENGCFVNDARVRDRCEVTPGDRIALGKHELRVRSAPPEELATPRPARRKSDAWDGARTYLVGIEPVGAAATSAAADATDDRVEPRHRKEGAAMRNENEGPAETEVEVAAEPVAAAIDFDFVGSLSDDEAADESDVVLAADEPDTGMVELPEAEVEAVSMHAGFIVQRDGKIERVAAWNGDTVVVGRAADCDVVLAQDEVSRRHARFERIGERFEVHDLGSVNGTFVNGRRVERAALCVGDVVQVESFQLTFVLDRQPIEGAVAPVLPTNEAEAQASDPGDRFAMTMLQEQMPYREGFTEVLARPGPVPEQELPAADVEESGDLIEGELFGDEVEVVAVSEPDADEKPDDAGLESVPLRGSSRSSSVQDLRRISQPNLEARELCVELRVRVELLPPALREAFEAAGASDLVLPAELRFRS